MKGSPILSTITATLLMAGAYLWLHFTLHTSTPITSHTSQVPNGADEASHSENTIVCYVDAHFSTPPSKFTISNPVSGKTIASISNLTDNEWSGEIHLLKGDSAELNIQAAWEKDDSTDSTRQNFIQLVLSPDQMEDSTVTLRNAGEIDTTATFQLRP